MEALEVKTNQVVFDDCVFYEWSQVLLHQRTEDGIETAKPINDIIDLSHREEIRLFRGLCIEDRQVDSHTYTLS